jgi:hypothetical protein
LTETPDCSGGADAIAVCLVEDVRVVLNVKGVCEFAGSVVARDHDVVPTTLLRKVNEPPIIEKVPLSGLPELERKFHLPSKAVMVPVSMTRLPESLL